MCEGPPACHANGPSRFWLAVGGNLGGRARVSGRCLLQACACLRNGWKAGRSRRLGCRLGQPSRMFRRADNRCLSGASRRSLILKPAQGVARGADPQQHHRPGCRLGDRRDRDAFRERAPVAVAARRAQVVRDAPPAGQSLNFRLDVSCDTVPMGPAFACEDRARLQA